MPFSLSMKTDIIGHYQWPLPSSTLAFTSLKGALEIMLYKFVCSLCEAVCTLNLY